MIAHIDRYPASDRSGVSPWNLRDLTFWTRLYTIPYSPSVAQHTSPWTAWLWGTTSTWNADCFVCGQRGELSQITNTLADALIPEYQVRSLETPIHEFHWRTNGSYYAVQCTSCGIVHPVWITVRVGLLFRLSVRLSFSTKTEICLRSWPVCCMTLHLIRYPWMIESAPGKIRNMNNLILNLQRSLGNVRLVSDCVIPSELKP